MFKKDDKVKIIEGNNLLKGKTGIVVEANNNQAKVKINVSEDKDLPRYLINIFENKNLELESLDLLTEDAATFDNDVEPENINENVMWTFQCEEESALGVAEAKNALLCTEDGYTGINPHEACSVNYDDNVAYVTYIPKDKADLDNAEDYVITTELSIEEFFDYGKWYSKVHNMKESKEGKQVCCICGEEYTGYGNNAEPYKEGRCCDECNKKFVIPSRLNKLRNSKNESLKLNEEEDVLKTFYVFDKNDNEIERFGDYGAEDAIKLLKSNPEAREVQYEYSSFPENLYKYATKLDNGKIRFWTYFKNPEENVNESLKLSEQELKAWCSDNDANYYTQDIKDDKVIIRGLNEDLAEYDFKTKELKVFDYSGTTSPEELTEEDDDNYIRDYVYDYDILEEAEVASWEFASVIATSENISEDDVITEAHDRGFKVYLIQAANYEKFVVASEKITEDDIMEDFAGYLEGNPKVTEVI